jgi:autotransporter family porin
MYLPDTSLGKPAMNKTHRVVWSDSLHAFVVTSEHSKARGKLSTSRKILATAVALSVGSLLTPSAQAAGSCATRGPTTLSQPTSVMCTLASGGTLTVTTTGAITTQGTAVLIGREATVPTTGNVSNNLLVSNAGRLNASQTGHGIALERTGARGLLSNLAGGVINTDSGAGVLIGGSLFDGTVRNAGRIQTQTGTGISVVDSQVAGDLDNRNAISSQVGISVQNSSLKGSILDKGNISSNQYAIVADRSQIGGNVNVEGSAAGGQGAIRLTHDTIGGSVINSGNLFAKQAAVLLDDTRVAGNLINSGSIVGGTAGGAGISIGHSVLGGSIRNSGTLTALDQGLSVSSTRLAGSIVNDGVISANENFLPNRGIGVQLTDDRIGGSIVNNGRVLGYHTGVELEGTTVAGGLRNTGQIASNGRAGVLLSHSQLGGDFYNSGNITGGLYDAIRLENSTLKGSLINDGNTSSSRGIIVQNSTIEKNLINNGEVLNGGYNINVDASTVGGTLRNNGSLTGNGLGAISVINGSTIGNGVVNTGSLTNRGGGAAILVRDSTIAKGGIANSDYISGSEGGISVQNSTVSGSIKNTGRIYTGASTEAAVLLRKSTLIGDLINTGYIEGSTGISVEQSTIVGSLRNSGGVGAGYTAINIVDSLIDGDFVTEKTGGAGGLAGLSMSNSTLTGRFVNNGSFGQSLYNGIGNTRILGGVTNTGSIVSYGVLGIGNSVLGNFNNSGTIRGESYGVSLYSSQVNRSFTNTGFINGVDVNKTHIGGSLQNGGTISGDANQKLGGGLSVSNSSVIEGGIVNSGLIGVASENRLSESALNVTDSSVLGGIANSGTLEGGTSLNIKQSLVGGNLTNSGRIDGYVNGIIIENSRITGDIRNSGTLTARLSGLRVQDSTVGGKLVNSGSMASRLGTLGVSNSVISGGITNSGMINSQDTNYIQNSTIGNFVNSGTLAGSGAAITFDNTRMNGAFVNSGLISGGRFSILDSPGGSIKQLQITGQDTAEFRGEVFAPQARVSVTQGSAYTLNDRNLFTVADFTNAGRLTLASNATATIDGNYSQTAAATLRTQAVDAGTYGKLVVTGTATLPNRARFDVDVTQSGQSFSGATLANVLSAGTLQSNGTYTVTSDSALFNFNGVKNGNSVDLVATPKSSTVVSQAVQGNGNASTLNAARALDSALASNPSLTPFFVGATSGAGVSSAIAQTLPSNAAATTGVAQSTLSTLNDIIQARIDANTGLASGDGFYGDKNLWMKPFGSWINQSERGDTPGYDASVYGMAFGVDALVDELTRLGLSFSYANADTNSKSDAAPQSAKVDLYQLTGYGSHTLAPNTELSFHVGVGRNRNDGERRLNLNGVGGKADADYDSTSFTAGAAVAKAFDLNPTTRFIPSVRADYTWLKDDSYQEKGSAALQPLLLDVKKHQTDQLILGLDGKLSHEVMPGTQVTGNLGVGYDVIHDDSMLVASYAGAPGQTFNSVGQSSSPWLARGGVGLSTRIASSGTELSVNYDAEARSDFTNQTVSLKLKVPF